LNITAEDILDSKMFKEAVSSAKQRILTEWAACKEGAVQREALWHQLQASDAIVRELRIIRDRDSVERQAREG